MMSVPMPAMFFLKVTVRNPKVSRKTLPKDPFGRIGVPVKRLAAIRITTPDAKNTKIALYFFRISFATITAKMMVSAIRNHEYILTFSFEIKETLIKSQSQI